MSSHTAVLSWLIKARHVLSMLSSDFELAQDIKRRSCKDRCMDENKPVSLQLLTDQTVSDKALALERMFFLRSINVAGISYMPRAEGFKY